METIAQMKKLKSMFSELKCLGLLLLLASIFTASSAQASIAAPKPPVLLKSNANWWKQSGRPQPVIGWDSLITDLKKQSYNVRQAVDDKGTLIFLIHMRVNKKGIVDFAEVWDGNSNDSLVRAAVISAIKSTPFSLYFTPKGKRNKESALVLMEIPGTIQQITTQPQDTTIPNQAITPARFLGGENAFSEFVASEFSYPSRCLEETINGYVRMRFMVNRNGVVTNCRIKEISKGCPEFGIEAIRVLKSCPKWIPATHNGKNISAWFEIPIALSVK
jgi:TonB family protein